MTGLAAGLVALAPPAMAQIVAISKTVPDTPAANPVQVAAPQIANIGTMRVPLSNASVSLPTITATVAASPEPSVYGSPFSVTASIPLGVSSVQVTGFFSFLVDGIPVGSAPIVGLSATVPVPANLYATLTPGVHTLTAVYSGDTNWAPTTITGTHTVAQFPTSLNLVLCVDPPGSNFPCGNPINTTPLISPITMYYGQSIDGVVTESASNLTGTLTFYSGSSIFCVLNANVQQGTQKCPTGSGVFPVGTTTVTVVYSGDSINAPSTSNPIVVTVNPDTTTATLTSSLNPSTFGQTVTFTATVTGNFATAAGQVSFLDGTTVLATLPLDATGQATFPTSSLAVGTHPITVRFAGSGSFNGSTSAILSQVVVGAGSQSAGFVLTATPSPVTVGVGDTAALLVNVRAVAGFSQPVKLTCIGLPAESTCSFVQPLVAAGGGSTTLQVAVTAPHNCDSNTPYFVGSGGSPAMPGTAAKIAICGLFGGGLALAGMRKRRKLLAGTIFVLALSLGGLAMLSGCGSCTDLGTKPGVYTFTVVGTAQNGPSNEVEMQRVPMTVTIP